MQSLLDLFIDAQEVENEGGDALDAYLDLLDAADERADAGRAEPSLKVLPPLLLRKPLNAFGSMPTLSSSSSRASTRSSSGSL